MKARIALAIREYRKRAESRTIVVPYADDVIIEFERSRDAEHRPDDEQACLTPQL